MFVVFAVTVMYRWTVKKEKRYRREFGSAYRAKKNMMFPVVL